MSGVVAGYDLPHLAPEATLRRVLRAALKAHLGDARDQPRPSDFAYWSPEFLGVDRAGVYRQLPPESQAAVLVDCAQGLLEEAYFVEKAGVGYAARMVLAAESTEERQLYGLIASEEATHLAQVAAYLPRPDPVGTADPFLRLLGDLIEDGPKPVLLLVIQVVLEGWGLTHYRGLAAGCRDAALKAVLEGIVLDEARHHGSGVVLLEARRLSPAEYAVALEALESFLGMVRAGPQGVAAALERAAGHLTKAQKVQVFRDLGAEEHSAARLATLRGLLGGEVAAGLLAELDGRGAFTPLPPERCVA